MTRRGIIRCLMVFLPLLLYLYFAVMLELIANVPEQGNSVTFQTDTIQKTFLEKTNISYLQQTKTDDAHFHEKPLLPERKKYGKFMSECQEYESKCLYGNIVFNCENIKSIKLQEKIGHGVTKQAFLGLFDGEKVVVKMVTRHQKEARECLDGLPNRDKSDNLKRSKCFVFPTMKLMKEILLLHQLKHEGFLTLFGYCVRSEESDSTDLSEHGVVAVYERGTSISVEKLKGLSMGDKIRQSMHLISFFQYLANSPLGSLRVRDFKMDHFLMVNSTIKMIDLDDIDNLEPSCDAYSIESNTKRLPCEYNLTCEMGLCNGHNAKRNMERANELFFRHLLTPDVFPRKCFKMLEDINQRLRELSVNYHGIRRSLKKLLDSVVYLH
ncbi:extracellular tyrosine-protein kinase PKDCC-like [Saccostrea echinata]|uniref:extracellular tyrosine-protein kinase PKDCC-like n=1 Tax=Saccostrea echinata TaxID=191078 RepID=UPI002A840615|nr:extracellular tyrosine-protein kinase PKDCC-like [Saccostrea echinata]